MKSGINGLLPSKYKGVANKIKLVSAEKQK
jgi:hypothetical protein